MLLCAHVLRKWKTGREKMPRAKGVEFQIRGLLLGQKLATFLVFKKLCIIIYHYLWAVM
jgi:hypothetical protein